MTSPQMVRLDEHLQRLRLNTVRERLEALLQEATKKELSYADFLDGLLTEEVSAKTAKHVTMRTNLARFPFIKGSGRRTWPWVSGSRRSSTATGCCSPRPRRC